MWNFSEMTREQLRVAAPEALAVLPVGATEQHGPHLATGMDYLTVERLVHGAAKIAGAEFPVIVTPVLPFGSSHHHLVFGGTMSLKTETYLAVLKELLECLVIDGFRRIFIVNGHGGNHELIQLAARDTALLHSADVAAGSYWTMAWEPLVKVAAYGPRFLPGHAGDFETSLMMAFRPELVDTTTIDTGGRAGLELLERRQPYREEWHGLWKAMDGYTDDPRSATAEKGREYAAVIEKALAEQFLSFSRQTGLR